MFELIGISGHAASGKDFLAKNYFKQLGYYNFSLAWHLKVDTIGKKEATREEVFITKPPKIRSLLQHKGTEDWRFKYGEDVWLDIMNEWLNLMSDEWGITKFICPDVRFLNEVNYIHKIDGKVFRIIAPKREKASKLSTEQKKHSSETALDHYDGFDGIIYNDPEYNETVEKQILTLLGEDLNMDMSIWDKMDEAFDTVFDKFDNVFGKVDSIFNKGKKK